MVEIVVLGLLLMLVVGSVIWAIWSADTASHIMLNIVSTNRDLIKRHDAWDAYCSLNIYQTTQQIQRRLLLFRDWKSCVDPKLVAAYETSYE